MFSHIYNQLNSKMSRNNSDFFDPMPTSSFYLICSLMTFQLILSTVILSTIIWYGFYEENNQRNLIHRLCGFLSFVVLVTNGYNTGLHLIAIISGPLPDWICYSMGLGSMIFSIASAVTLNEILLLKYLYICIWKHVRFVHDDFFGTFLPTLNAFISVYFSLLASEGWTLGPFYDYFSCPNLTSQASEDSKLVIIIIGVFSSSFHLISYVMIYRQKRFLEISEHNGNQISMAKLELIQNFSMYAFVSVLSLFPVVVRYLVKSEFSLWTQIVPLVYVPLLITVVMPMLYIAKNPNLRKAVKTEFRETFHLDHIQIMS